MKVLTNSLVFLLIFLIKTLSAALIEDDYVDDFEVLDVGWEKLESLK